MQRGWRTRRRRGQARRAAAGAAASRPACPLAGRPARGEPRKVLKGDRHSTTGKAHKEALRHPQPPRGQCPGSTSDRDDPPEQLPSPHRGRRDRSLPLRASNRDNQTLPLHVPTVDATTYTAIQPHRNQTRKHLLLRRRKNHVGPNRLETQHSRSPSGH